jgi:hypothetical protein
MNGLTKAASDVLAERERQRQKWGDAHDDQHKNDQIAYGAVSYLLPGQAVMPADWSYNSKVRDREPRREQLVKGAALALAAVEQFDRAAAKVRCPNCAGRGYMDTFGDVSCGACNGTGRTAGVAGKQDQTLAPKVPDGASRG